MAAVVAHSLLRCPLPVQYLAWSQCPLWWDAPFQYPRVHCMIPAHAVVQHVTALQYCKCT
jgi:hypothetical protein